MPTGSYQRAPLKGPDTMAKHTSKALRRVRVSTALPLLTTASKVALSVGLTAAADQHYRAISANGSWNVQDLTAGDGPVVVGFSHSDYTDGEIEEAIEALTAISQGDLVAQERANRLVRVVGIVTDDDPTLNDGNPVKTRLNWAIPIGKFVDLFIYNDGVNFTTGATVSFNGDLWVKDSR